MMDVYVAESDSESGSSQEVVGSAARSEQFLQEFGVQFQRLTYSTSVLTTLLINFVMGEDSMSRADTLPRVLQSLSEVDGERLQQMAEWLTPDDRNIWLEVANRVTECKEQAYRQMKQIADMKYSELKQQSMKISELEKSIENRDKVIMSLKAADNVLLWEKEKARVLKDHQATIDRLNDKVKELETQRDHYHRKLTEQQDDLKMEKLKTDLTKRRSTINAMPESSDLVMLEDLKRKTYLYESDLNRGQQALNGFQTDMLGMWGGIQSEVSMLVELTTETIMKRKLQTLTETIDNIKCAVAGERDLGVVRADLSHHYLPGLAGSDFFVTSKGKKVTIKQMSIRSFNNLGSKLDVKYPAKRLPPLKPAAARANGQSLEEQSANPSLLNNGESLNTLAVMKHFPTLSVNYVKTQWENFKNYDTDKNGELDLSEIMAAITKMKSNDVRPDQIEAAVREVDTDGSGTMDFYEYLQVAMLLEQKKGKSALFHSADVKKYNRQISKTCVIQ